MLAASALQEQARASPGSSRTEIGKPLAHTRETVLHRNDVVGDLGGVIRLVGGWDLSGLEPQELAHVSLRALDPGTQHRLQTEVRPDEEVWVGDQPTDAAQAVDCTGRLVEQLDHLVGQ